MHAKHSESSPPHQGLHMPMRPALPRHPRLPLSPVTRLYPGRSPLRRTAAQRSCWQCAVGTRSAWRLSSRRAPIPMQRPMCATPAALLLSPSSPPQSLPTLDMGSAKGTVSEPICATLLPLPSPTLAPLHRHAPPSWSLPVAQDGAAALFCAAMYGHHQCVMALIAAGADCKAKNNVRLTY